MRGQLCGQSLGKTNDTELGGTIGDNHSTTEFRGVRADIDYPSFATGTKQRTSGLATQKTPLQIHINHTIPILFTDMFQGSYMNHARRIDQSVQLSKSRFARVHCRSYRACRSDVELQG